MATSQTRRIAAAWGRQVAFAGWNPPIPAEVFKLVTAYLPDTSDGFDLEDAQNSVGVFLPKVLDLLHKAQGDRYYMNASESHGKIFYYFSPRQPVDAFNITLYVKEGQAYLSFGYMPSKANGMLDVQNMKTEKVTSDPDVAGLSLMRIVRTLLTKI